MDEKQLNELLADKLALDQMYGECLRALHDARKQIILRDEKIKKLVAQIDILLEKEQEAEESNENKSS